MLKKNDDKQAAQSVAGGSMDHKKQLDELTRSISLFVAELNSASEEILRKLDEKEQRLNNLMQDAQRVIDRMELPVREELVAVPERFDQASMEADNRGVLLEQRYRSIFDLYDQGVSIADIARKVNMEKGQVQLIFNLRRKV
jgi:DNA-binding NarL/FixJ family response regulator